MSPHEQLLRIRRPQEIRRYRPSRQGPGGLQFFQYYGSVTGQDGALTKREKALIALAISHAQKCPYCIDAYTTTCLEKGSNLKEMTEAVHVASAIRGGATLIHGVQMRKVAKKISM